MASRVGFAVTVLLVTALATSATAARQPTTGTAMFVVRHDPRLCPSPMCGGYWVAAANAARTRCADGIRRPRCYAARAFAAGGVAIGDIPEEWLVRGTLDVGRDDLGKLVVSAVYAPAGTPKVGGEFYRVFDNEVRCVRAPCFSTTANRVNGSTRTTVSEVDLAASRANPAVIRRAEAALATMAGLYVRGRIAKSPDGGRVLRALRLYIRVS